MFLKDVRYLGAQRLVTQVMYVLAVDQYTTLGRLVVTGYEIGEARLAGTGRADDGHQFTHVE